MARTLDQLMVSKVTYKQSDGGNQAISFDISVGQFQVIFVHGLRVNLCPAWQSGDYNYLWSLDQRNANNTEIPILSRTEIVNSSSVIARGRFCYSLNGTDSIYMPPQEISFPIPYCLVRSPSFVVNEGGPDTVTQIDADLYYTKKIVGQNEITKLLKYWFAGESRGRREPGRSIP